MSLTLQRHFDLGKISPFFAMQLSKGKRTCNRSFHKTYLTGEAAFRLKSLICFTLC